MTNERSTDTGLEQEDPQEAAISPARSRTETIFIVAVLSLAAGVPLALFGLYFFADHIATVASILISALVLFAIIGVLVVRNREAVFDRLVGQLESAASQLLDPLINAAEGAANRDASRTRQQLTKFGRMAASQYYWMQTRRWIVTGAIGLVIAFAGLVGSSLLKRQNDLIRQQNTYFQEQIRQQQTQIEAQRQIANQTARDEAIQRIYGSAFSEDQRVRAEAVRSLVTVERANIELGSNTIPTDFVNLANAPLAKAWLDSAKLAKVSFRNADLQGANLNSADLREASFRFARLNEATFIQATASEAAFGHTDATSAVFDNADLRKARFGHVILTNASFRGADVAGAFFQKCDLRNADLDELKGWREIDSIEGTSLFGVQNAPKGFIEWATANGAVIEPDARDDLPEKIEAYRRLEEKR